MRPLALGFVLVLASVGTASAERAWVLWNIPKMDAPNPTPAPFKSFTTLAACEETRTQLVGADETRDELLAPGQRLIRRAFARVVCLPDTVDPRGPKAR
jgi:hypothetical protein